MPFLPWHRSRSRLKVKGHRRGGVCVLWMLLVSLFFCYPQSNFFYSIQSYIGEEYQFQSLCVFCACMFVFFCLSDNRCVLSVHRSISNRWCGNRESTLISILQKSLLITYMVKTQAKKKLPKTHISFKERNRIYVLYFVIIGNNCFIFLIV